MSHTTITDTIGTESHTRTGLRNSIRIAGFALALIMLGLLSGPAQLRVHAAGGGGNGGGGNGGGGGKLTLPVLITQSYTFDTNSDGAVSTTAAIDTICRTDGVMYASTGTTCVTDRFSVDAAGTKQLVYTGEVAQPWVDKLNAWWTDPARRATSGKNGGTLPSPTCLTNLFTVNPQILPSQAGLNPVCTLPDGA